MYTGPAFPNSGSGVLPAQLETETPSAEAHPTFKESSSPALDFSSLLITNDLEFLIPGISLSVAWCPQPSVTQMLNGKCQIQEGVLYCMAIKEYYPKVWN